MADFFQNGTITTFHRIGENDFSDLERQLVAFSKRRPIALVLPCLYSELDRPALRHIMHTLQRVPYLDQLVVALGGADEEQFRYAQRYFAPLEDERLSVRLLWNGGPRLQRVYDFMARNGLPCGGHGKGRAAWAAFGYILAAGRAEVIVGHDCDIVTYNRDFLARLTYPIADPTGGFAFCKGYYARTSDRMHGRVMRLFVTPLVRAMRESVGDESFLRYLDSFRYALAGEFAMDADLARRIRIPTDWGLEVGMLAEVYRNCAPQEVCQVDIADSYDHKHRPLAGDDSRHGLQRMATEIAQSLLCTLRDEGAKLDEHTLEALLTRYRQIGVDFVDRYAREARLNGLAYDERGETKAVQTFANALKTAMGHIAAGQRHRPWTSSWNHVLSVAPEVMDRLYDAVEADNARAVTMVPRPR